MDAFLELKSTVVLELTEGEAGALSAICGYGPTEFLKWFHKNLGKHYIEPYEKDIKTLFDKARALNQEVEKIKKVRATLNTIKL